MPRLNKALVAGVSGSATPEGSTGVIAVERAIRLLGAFSGREPSLPLVELSRRAQLNKSTALRFARTLAASKYLVRLPDGTWRLGPAAGALGARYQSAFDANDVMMPVLRDLAKSCGHSASLFVRESDRRVCLFRVESVEDARPSVHSGTAFPLDKGAAGRVILAFSGMAGEPYETIRRQGFCIGVNERSTDDASAAAPVFGSNWQVFGAISVSGAASRLSQADLSKFANRVSAAAKRASRALGSTFVNRLRR